MNALATNSFDLPRLGAAFRLPGDFASAEPWGSGHINDTFRATWGGNGEPRRYIHQRINDHVFPDPQAVMRNIAAVTGHVRTKLEAAGTDDLDRRVLTLVPARDGRDFHVDAEGHYWRTYLFVEKSRSVDLMEGSGQAFKAGRAFGEFLVLLSDYDGPRLVETISGFHDTPRRFANFVRALEKDAQGRAAGCQAEATALLATEKQAGAIAALHDRGLLPERIVHNDTKLNNLLLDEQTGEPLCVIDLDTVMPGYALHDFGDLVRTGAARATGSATGSWFAGSTRLTAPNASIANATAIVNLVRIIIPPTPVVSDKTDAGIAAPTEPKRIARSTSAADATAP